MKRLLLVLCLLASPLAAQPSRWALATQVKPGFATTALGDTYCALNATTFGRIVGNTTTTRKFSISLGTGSVSACPVWGVLVSGDIPNNAANTTGSAAKWTTARLLAGNSVDGSANVTFSNKFIVQGTTDAGLSGAQFLGALGTGVLKNTVTTGVLSIAAAADLPSLLTTKGDLGCFSTVPTRLGIGTDTYVLTADATQTCGYKWGASSGGGGGSVTTKGDLQTYSTVAARLPVGADGYALVADSTQATGLKYAAMTGAAGAPVGLVQIAQIVTSASQATVDFTSIPAGYTDLEVRYQARSNVVGSGEYASVKVNNDGTSGNYSAGSVIRGTNNTASSFGTTPSASGMQLSTVPGTTTTASYTLDCSTRFNNYAGTTFYKTALSTCAFLYGTQAFKEEIEVVWKSTAAITRLTFIVPTSFVNGSTFTLYGTVTGGASTVVLQPTTPGTAQTGNANLTGTVIAGGFSGPLTGNVTGNASGSAATLSTPRAINGVAFDGSAPITVTADASTLSGTTLHSTVVNSSLTSVGTLGVLTVVHTGTTPSLTAAAAVNSRWVAASPGLGTALALTIDANPPYAAALQVRHGLYDGYTYPLLLNPLGGNVGIGASTFGTSANLVLGISNGTAPSTSPANMVQLWAEDVSASSELRVRDEAGNVTTLSPHNFSMFTPDASQIFPWSYYSKNAHIGKEMSVDMYGLAAAVEKLTGQKFIYLADLPADQIEDWTAQQATDKVTIEKQRLDKAMAAEVEVVVADAVEVVAVTQERPSATLTESVTKYALDAKTGKVKAVTETKPKVETVATGETETRLKVGVRLDETTGKFWRHVRADEAVVEPYTPKAPPAWIADRMKKK